MTTPLALVNARLIDGTGAPPRDAWSVVVAILQDRRLVKDVLSGVAHAV